MIGEQDKPKDMLPAGLDSNAVPDDYESPAATSEEAEERFRKTFLFDPFPEIAPSLLNNADIYDYVRMTGMLFPFQTERKDASGKLEKTLKRASYEVPIGQKCIYWKPNNNQCVTVDLSKADEFTLEPNSIAFVQIQPRIRLPAYIAIRFNLRIKHVHRGLLLGTGPLVDPGFRGDLLIPIHNLTTNPYSIKKDEGLIWVEFTKTTTNEQWDNPAHRAWKKDRYKRQGKIHEFTDTKNNMDPAYYLYQAHGSNPIQSSIPFSIYRSEQAATSANENASRAAAKAGEAAQSAETIKRQIQVGAVVAALTSALVLYMEIILPTHGLVQDSRPIVQSAVTMYQEQALRVTEAKKSAEEAKHHSEEAARKIAELENRILTLQTELAQLQEFKGELPNKKATQPANEKRPH